MKYILTYWPNYTFKPSLSLLNMVPFASIISLYKGFALGQIKLTRVYNNSGRKLSSLYIYSNFKNCREIK